MRIAKGGSEKKIAHGMNQSLIRLGLIAPQRKERPVEIEPFNITLPKKKTRGASR